MLHCVLQSTMPDPKKAPNRLGERAVDTPSLASDAPAHQESFVARGRYLVNSTVLVEAFVCLYVRIDDETRSFPSTLSPEVFGQQIHPFVNERDDLLIRQLPGIWEQRFPTHGK